MQTVGGGSGLAPSTAVRAIAGGGSNITLSSPWMGASGTATLKIFANQWNYAVAFELPVP